MHQGALPLKGLIYSMNYFLQNKAVLTFNAKTSEILVANDVACDMFAYTHDELIGMKMSKMFTKSDEARQEALGRATY